MDIKNISLEFATKLLSLPRAIGNHPETSELVQISIGSYGPYIKYNGASFKAGDVDVFTITLEEALEIISKAERTKTKRSFTAKNNSKKTAKTSKIDKATKDKKDTKNIEEKKATKAQKTAKSAKTVKDTKSKKTAKNSKTVKIAKTIKTT